MVDQLKGIGAGGGFPPGDRRTRGGKSAPKEPAPAPPAPGDEARLGPGPVLEVRALAERLESLQRALASAPAGQGREVLRAGLAGAEVTMANLLGARPERVDEALSSAVRAMKGTGDLSPERVLSLLGGKT